MKNKVKSKAIINFGIQIFKVTADKAEILNVKENLESTTKECLSQPDPIPVVVDRTLDDALSKLPDDGLLNSLSLKYNSKTSERWIVATKNIKPGKVLAHVEPLARVLAFDAIYTHCAECFQVAWASIACDHCVNALYCSEECKSLAWKRYHDIECPVRNYMKTEKWMETIYLALKFTILAIKDAKGVDNLRQELLRIKKCVGKGFVQIFQKHNAQFFVYFGEMKHEKKPCEPLNADIIQIVCFRSLQIFVQRER